jgi:pyridoxamine 5'-phosphate oxidase
MEQKVTVADLRQEYMFNGLSEADVDPDPLRQFQLWFDQAVAAGLPEPNAMTLATATPQGRPSARMVLLKGFDAGGFAFYTNYESRKGHELAANPWAALVFFWVDLARQIRVEGQVAQLPSELSDAYYQSRPLGSRLGAWASAQSQVIADRGVLDRRLEALQTEYAEQPVPRPPHWGGYRVSPVSIEFWQGRPNRLHDRLRYWRTETGDWLIERLSP